MQRGFSRHCHKFQSLGKGFMQIGIFSSKMAQTLEKIITEIKLN